MERLLQVLGAVLARGTGVVALQDLAAEVGLPQSTVHRILQLCVAHGMLRQGPDQRYAIGPALLAVSVSAGEDLGLRDFVRPELEELARSVGEDAYLTMRVGYAGVFVTRSASPRPIRVIEPLFEKLPLHCGASRKVLLAHTTSAFLDEYLEQGELQRFTEHTITDPEELRAELARIREAGLGISLGERSGEIGGVAAPVYGPWDNVLASVSVLAPVTTLTGAHHSEFVDQVRRCADRISRRLQFSRLLDRGSSANSLSFSTDAAVDPQRQTGTSTV